MMKHFSILLALVVLSFNGAAFGDETDAGEEKSNDTVTFRPIAKSNDKKAFAEAFVPRDRTIKQTISFVRGVESLTKGQQIDFKKSVPTDASFVLHGVIFQKEIPEANSSSIIVDISDVNSSPAKIKSAKFFDWRTKAWTFLSNDVVSLEFKAGKSKDQLVVSGKIEVPPMLFMGEPEGKIVLIENPLSIESKPKTLASSVNWLMKMKPVFRY